MARARHRSVGVMVVNVDRFDAVNENFGRALGDRLLVELGQRLVECSLRTDTIGRLEGDKFIVVRGAVGDPSEMVSYADEIRAALEQPFLLDGEAEVVTVSIGIALGSQDESPDRLMSDAELAVVHAKESGGDRAVLFSENLARSRSPASVETGLRRALAEGEFVLYYQPIIDLQRGRFIGTEALIRWMDPTRGLVLPDDFIPIAEETGLIVPIGEWVAGEACRQVSAWNRERPEDPCFSGRSRFQALTWRHASPATHSPIGTMSPVSSAIGMKSSGRTRPRVGSIQRISASVPMKCPRCKSMMGW